MCSSKMSLSEAACIPASPDGARPPEHGRQEADKSKMIMTGPAPLA